MGSLAERPGREMAGKAVSETLGQHLRHWLRDRLVSWFGALLRGSRKIYDGPSPDESDSEDSPRARREPLRREASAEIAAAASGAPPPKKRSKAWFLLGLLTMFLVGLGAAGSAAYWYFEAAIAANDQLAAAALEEAKAADKKIADAQRASAALKEDLVTLKLQRQSDQARINQLLHLLRNRGTPVPAAPAVVSNGGASSPSQVSGRSAAAPATEDACTLSSGAVGQQFKDCIAAMNAGQK